MKCGSVYVLGMPRLGAGAEPWAATSHAVVSERRRAASPDRRRAPERRSRSRSPHRRRDDERNARRRRSPSPSRQRHAPEAPRSRASERAERRRERSRAERPAEPGELLGSPLMRRCLVKVTPEEVGDTTEEDLMQQMGFTGFDTTKNKKVPGNVDGMAKVNKPRKYRQYMNRKGGFNRPLDYIA